MAVKVRLCDPLRQYAGNRSNLIVDSCETVTDVIRSLESQYPGIERRILDDQDHIRRFVNVFLNGNLLVRSPEKTNLISGDELFIIQSVAGG